jgi:hypothetical protein
LNGAGGARTVGAVGRNITANCLRLAALVFYGKHAGVLVRARELAVGVNASTDLISRSHSKWVSNLIDANPRALFDVFMHSWSPEVGDAMDALWGPMLVGRLHEPTRYTDAVTGHLAFQCSSPELRNCPRTASQLLSVYKALALKRDHELSTGLRYDFVITARHDVSIMRPHTIPETIFADSAADDSQIWFPAACSKTRCTPSRPMKLPNGCYLSGRRCQTADENYQRSVVAGEKLGVMPVVQDLLFAGSSTAVDKMGEAVHNYHAMARAIMAAGETYTHSHLMWPYHAMRSGMKARWDLIDSRHVTFTRDEAAFVSQCWVDLSASLTMNGQTTAALHPGMGDACPYDAVMVCPCSGA